MKRCKHPKHAETWAFGVIRGRRLPLVRRLCMICGADTGVYSLKRRKRK